MAFPIIFPMKQALATPPGGVFSVGEPEDDGVAELFEEAGFRCARFRRRWGGEKKWQWKRPDDVGDPTTFSYFFLSFVYNFLYDH